MRRLVRRSGAAGVLLAVFCICAFPAQAAVRADDQGLSPSDMALRFYQKYISDLRYGNCRFEPSCSQFAMEVIGEKGLLIGSSLAADRLIRCNHSAHRYHEHTSGGRLSDPPAGSLPLKARPEVPQWLMPAADLPLPLAGDIADADLGGKAPVRAGPAHRRLYLEDVAGFAEALERDGDCERASTEYLRVAYLGGTTELRFWAHMRTGRCLYRNGMWAAAASEFREAAGFGQASDERNLARFMEAGSAFNQREYGVCSDLLDRLVLPEGLPGSDCSGGSDAGTVVTGEHHLFLEGLCLMGLADWDRAAGSFANVLDLCPGSRNGRRAAFLAAQAERGHDLPHRSPAAAAVMSALVPGSGQMYSGRFTDGLRHLIFDGLLIYTVYWFAREENYTGAYLAAGITLPFYFGNIVGARRSAEWFNSNKQTEFLRNSINATR